MQVAGEKISLWTVRDANEICFPDPLCTDPEYVQFECLSHQIAYRWIAQKLGQKVQNLGGLDYPVWAWKTPPELNGKWGDPGQSMCLVEFTMPEDKVLLCDYQSWHIVLMNKYVASTDSDYLCFQKKLQLSNAADEWPYPKPFHSIVVESWSRIFNVSDRCEDESDVQAVLWSIPGNAVKKIQYFKSS